MFYRLLQVNKHLLFLMFATILAGLPFLSSQMLFIHDTLYKFIDFYYVYNHFYFFGDLPLWIPLVGYGLPADFLMFMMQPTELAAMFFGRALGVKDALLLFKLAMLLNQCLFTLGIYLLSKRFFSSKLVVCMVSFGAILTNSWFFQVGMNFDIFFMLPLVFFFIIKFIETKNPTFLWMGALVETFSLVGNVPYIPPFHLLIFISFLIPLFFHRPSLMWDFINWRIFVHPLFLIFFSFLLLLSYYLKDIFQGIYITDRDPVTGNVPLHNFLSYGFQPLAGIVLTFFKGDVPHGDMTCYVGLLPLLAIPYGLVRRKDPYFRSLAFVALVVFWFSLGGWFSTFTYYFIPLMVKYRHLRYSLNFLKVILLFLGGFGIDQVLKDLENKTTAYSVSSSTLKSISLLILISVCFVDFLLNMKTYDLNLFHLLRSDYRFYSFLFAPFLLMGRYLIYFGALVCLLIVLCKHAKASDKYVVRIGLLFFLIYLADVILFYLLVFIQAPFCPQTIHVDNEFDVQPQKFITYRPLYHTFWKDGPFPVGSTVCLLASPFGYNPLLFTPFQLPVSEQHQKVLRLLFSNRGGFSNRGDFQQYLHQNLQLILGSDSILNYLKIHMVSAGVKEMIMARNGQCLRDGFILPLQDHLFIRSLGLNSKIRLVRKVVFANQFQSLKIFQETVDPYNNLVLTGLPMTPSMVETTQVEDNVIVTYFSANRIVIKALAGTPAWLVYADAYHPGWKATINGKPMPVLRANLGFKAVPLDSGLNEVIFNFSDGTRFWLRNTLYTLALLFGVLATVVLSISPWIVTAVPAANSGTLFYDEQALPFDDSFLTMKCWLGWTAVASLAAAVWVVLELNYIIFLLLFFVTFLLFLYILFLSETSSSAKKNQHKRLGKMSLLAGLFLVIWVINTGLMLHFNVLMLTLFGAYMLGAIPGFLWNPLKS